MPSYSVVPPAGGNRYDWQSDHILVKADMAATGGTVTVVEDTLDPGFLLPRHHHRAMTEVFCVLDGEVTFRFDDATEVATRGTTVTIPPRIWHEVTSERGGTLITMFAPGGFEGYLEELTRLTAEERRDEVLIRELGERYDTWSAE